MAFLVGRVNRIGGDKELDFVRVEVFDRQDNVHVLSSYGGQGALIMGYITAGHWYTFDYTPAELASGLLGYIERVRPA